MLHRPTTNEEICEVVRPCKFFLYSDLWKIKNVNEFLPKSIILYQTAKIGHWIGIFINKEGLNVFDSLGYLPDEELEKIPEDIRIENNENYTYLTKLLSQAPFIIYNDHRYQKKGTSTCGMHVAFRLLHSYMTDEEYNKVMNNIKDKDRYVANYFMEKLNNIR